MRDFRNFTNLYSLTKTLRFELRPVGETRKFLDKIRPRDEERDKWYQEIMKPIFDKLHNDFIVESLQNIQFPEDKLEKVEQLIREGEQKELENNKENKLLSSLREVVCQSFEKTAERWKEKYDGQKYYFYQEKGEKIIKKEGKVKLTFKKSKGYEILTSKNIVGLLLYLYKADEEKIKIISTFKDFFLYFNSFNQNRENYYKNESKKTEVAYRIINENLIRFIKNRLKFKEIIKYLEDLQKFSNQFTLKDYAKVLTQKDIDNFNKNIIGEINYQVNLYNQKNKTRLPKLEILYKQIGAPQEKNFIFAIEEGKEWQELENLKQTQNKTVIIDKQEVKLLDALRNLYKEFFSQPENFSLAEIYFNKQAINTLSNRWLVSWQILADLLKIKQDKTGEAKIPKQISLESLRDVLSEIKNNKEVNADGKENYSLFAYFKAGRGGKYETIIKNSSNGWQAFIKIWQKEIEDIFQEIASVIEEFEEKRKKVFNKKDDGEFIKRFCDAYLAIERMVKYHRVGDELSKETNFYNILDVYYEESELNKYYNAFRNYISQKPYSKDKIKLNFENSNLLGGWSEGQEENKGAVLLCKKENNKTRYFLGILKNRQLFKKSHKPSVYKDDSNFFRLLLRTLAFKTLSGKGFKSRFNKSFTQLPDKEAVEKLQILIKEKYLDKYPALKKVVDKKYNSKKDFTKEVNKILNDSYYMGFVSIDETKIMEAVKNGELYLFEVYNKDFSEFKQKESQENVHTKYWQALFSEDNFKSPLIALAGGGEIFFRKGQANKLNQYKDKKYIDKETGEEKPVLEHRRFAKDKIFFHTPIKINFKSPRNLKFNQKVNKEYLQKDKTKIIGIDRGEKHLIYICVIDQNGNIIEQKSLNKIKMGDKEVDFQETLKERAGEMMEARKNWAEIGAIKNFKEGYLSYVIYEIYKLITEHQAIVAMEDLSVQFKVKRTAEVEYALYKKFELALAKKLNHLILKDKKPEEIGGALNALQLTPKIEAGNIGFFEKAKQWGILYYVRPNYTSTTDPLTGWRKHKYISNSATIQKIKDFFLKEKIKIFFDKEKDCFAFSYDHNRKQWVLYCHRNLERFRYIPKKKKTEKINLYQEFDNLLGSYKNSSDILADLEKAEKFDWKKLVYLWNLLNQIRNTDRDKRGNENDFLQSPVWFEKIQDFFDSRKTDYYQKKFNLNLPQNGDANGAYNIARKGLIVLNKILENPHTKDLFVSDVEWDKFVAK